MKDLFRNMVGKIMILHVVEDISESYGGPARSLPEYVHALEVIGARCEVWSISDSESCDNVLIDKYSIKSRVFKRNGLARFSILYTLALLDLLRERNDLFVHFHSVWSYPTWIGMILCSFYSVPYGLSPRSSLYVESLKKNYYFKRFLSGLFLRRYICGCEFIHVTDEKERLDVEKYGYQGRVAVVSHGVDTAEFDFELSRNYACNNLGIESDRKYFLYFSRLHPRKNIELLLSAFESVRSDFPEACILIAGTGDAGYIAHIENKFSNVFRDGQAVSLGMVSGGERALVFDVSCFFVLISEFENFGMSIAESLASATPVLISNRTPWTKCVNNDLGLVVDVNLKDVEQGLRSMLSIPKNELEKMGMRGNEYVKKNHSWGRVSLEMIGLYNGLQG